MLLFWLGAILQTAEHKRIYFGNLASLVTIHCYCMQINNESKKSEKGLKAYLQYISITNNNVFSFQLFWLKNDELLNYKTTVNINNSLK